jgi:MYXO-CTERM domain-containing protein
MCGDGTVNRTAGEQCEDGELCDPATCQLDFSLGGGCAGCNSRNPDAGWILGLGLLAVARRRRRYNSRRSS